MLDSPVIRTLSLRNCSKTCSAGLEKKKLRNLCLLIKLHVLSFLCIILSGMVADDSAVLFQENIFQQCSLDVILFLVLSCFTPVGFLSMCAHLCVAMAGAFHPV